jgi:hypothetical protein
MGQSSATGARIEYSRLCFAPRTARNEQDQTQEQNFTLVA